MPGLTETSPLVKGNELNRTALREQFTRVRAFTEHLARPLSEEDCVVQSMPDASPAKWHLAHTAWYFENFVLQAAIRGYEPVDAAYGYLFNSYYNAVGERHPRPLRGLLTRPSLAEVCRYRAEIDRRVLESIDGLPQVLLPVLELGLHHEQQHQELLLTDLKHLFSCNPLRPAYGNSSSPGSDTPPQAVRAGSEERVDDFSDGVYAIGHSGDGFAFDNETPRHKVWLESFRVSHRLVTNGDYFRFVEEGGYERPEFWLSDGWDEVRRNGWQAPLYWERRDNGWSVFTLSGMRELHPCEPVCHISFYEADAFARWAGARLPTEAEWEVAAAAVAPEGNFLDSGCLHPLPAGESSTQFFGDVWEWTASPYVAYPGYRPAAGALGEYNGKFMCNQMVLRGGSCTSPASHIRATYRNFFKPAARWQFSGVRLAW